MIMEYIFYLAQQHFLMSVAVIASLMALLAFFLRRKDTSDTCRMVVYIIEVLLLLLLFSFLCIKDDMIRKKSESTMISGNPSEYFTFEYKY